MKNVTISVLGLHRFLQMPTGVETPHEKVQAPFWLVQTRPRPSPPRRGPCRGLRLRGRAGLEARCPGVQSPGSACFLPQHRGDSPVRVCEREGEDTQASEFKFQFSLWDLDVNLLGLKSRRGCNSFNRVWKLLR